MYAFALWIPSCHQSPGSSAFACSNLNLVKFSSLGVLISVALLLVPGHMDFLGSDDFS
jgi:hypothetical protein